MSRKSGCGFLNPTSIEVTFQPKVIDRSKDPRFMLAVLHIVSLWPVNFLLLVYRRRQP